jgi:hypothetical protein
MPHDLSTTIDRGPIEHGREKPAIVTQPLKQSVGPPPVTLNWQEELVGWPQEWRELWDERAAIMEYGGDLARDDAERHAFELLQDVISHS